MLIKMRNTLGPLFLILCCPPFAILMWYTNTQLDKSSYTLYQMMMEQGVLQVIYTIWQPVFFGSVMAWKIILIFAAFELSLMRLLPGSKF